MAGSLAIIAPLHAETGNILQDSDPLGAICTDRPTKSSAACTVPKGHWQIEADVTNYSESRSGNLNSQTLLATNPTLKYGINSYMDFQVNWVPYSQIWTQDRVTHEKHNYGGSGDVIMRWKTRYYEDDRFSLAVIPYVKAPTAGHKIGNHHWEGGMVAAANIKLPAGFLLTLAPEVDIVLNDDNKGMHAAMQNVFNLARPLTNRLTLIGELWSATNFDPSGKTTQYSADSALVYALTQTIQLDIGANVGLNRDTPAEQIYLGISKRF
ncbi:transporter [Zymomonas mobilis]|uniref:transporter n=1 Tax=Zymomonas mobilis TaxID=542 RepID=UPI0039EAB751